MTQPLPQTATLVNRLVSLSCFVIFFFSSPSASFTINILDSSNVPVPCEDVQCSVVAFRLNIRGT